MHPSSRTSGYPPQSVVAAFEAISIDDCRDLMGKDCPLSDSTIESLVASLGVLADIAIDVSVQTNP